MLLFRALETDSACNLPVPGCLSSHVEHLEIERIEYAIGEAHLLPSAELTNFRSLTIDRDIGPCDVCSIASPVIDQGTTPLCDELLTELTTAMKTFSLDTMDHLFRSGLFLPLSG